MSTIYTLNGQQVYDTYDAAGNKKTVNAQTGQVVNTAGATPRVQVPTQSTSYGTTNTNPTAPAIQNSATPPPAIAPVQNNFTSTNSANSTGNLNSPVSGSFPTTSLQPGDTGPAVQQLQQWLVANGYMTQAQMNTGAGIYGPQTTTAVQALQSKLGVDNSTGAGYWGPRTLAAVQNSGAPAGGAGGAGGASGITFTPTGDASLDAILKSITGVASNLIGQGYTIPPGLQITPALVSQFLTYAHQAIDPYSQQLLSARLADVNSNLSAQGTQFANSTAERIQQFGSDLSAEQNNAGANGTAFSGQRNINELNLQNTANRDLSTLGANAAYNIGATARAGAADVGAANAGGIALPSLAGGSVSLTGGQRGSSSTGAGLNYNYTPSIYTVGNIPSAQTGAVNQQQQNYLSQFGTLAGAQSNSGRSVSDLIGMMSGLPAGYTVPSNLK